MKMNKYFSKLPDIFSALPSFGFLNTGLQPYLLLKLLFPALFRCIGPRFYRIFLPRGVKVSKNLCISYWLV